MKQASVMASMAAILLSSCLLSGCLINSHSENVVEPEAERLKVHFETDKALVDFQHSVAKRYRSGEAVEGESAFLFPFLVHTEERDVLSENAFYNRQVKKADVDGDGTISEAESRAYVCAE